MSNCGSFSVVSSVVARVVAPVESLTVLDSAMAEVFSCHALTSGCQLPQDGKLRGTAGMSSCSPTLKINDIPISA